NGFISSENQLSIKGYDAVAIGIGMGCEKETNHFLYRILEQIECPVIIDADGLSHIKSHLDLVKRKENPIILTPHPGEMASLLDINIDELMKRPFHYSLKFARDYQVYIILKGRFTIITAPTGKQAVNLTGNPGLAKGGSGDVLTGIILT